MCHELRFLVCITIRPNMNTLFSPLFGHNRIWIGYLIQPYKIWYYMSSHLHNALLNSSQHQIHTHFFRVDHLRSGFQRRSLQPVFSFFYRIWIATRPTTTTKHWKKFTKKPLKNKNCHKLNVTHRDAGSSVENSSTELSARRIAFMPRMHTQLPQNWQFNFITHFLRKLGCSGFRGIADGRQLQQKSSDYVLMELGCSAYAQDVSCANG